MSAAQTLSLADSPTPTPKPLNLIQKLALVMAAVESVPKNGRNEFHRYDYATEADIGRAVRKKMSELGVMIIPSVLSLDWRDIETKGGGKERIATLHVKYTVTDGFEERSFVVIGEGQDRGDKATYKAMTGAGKYALMKLFLIPTGDDPENDSEEHRAPAKRAEPPMVTQATGKQPAAKRSAEERKRDIVAELKSFGYEPAGITQFVKETLGHDKAQDDADLDRLESALVIIRASKNADKAADLNY